MFKVMSINKDIFTNPLSLIRRSKISSSYLFLCLNNVALQTHIGRFHLWLLGNGQVKTTRVRGISHQNYPFRIWEHPGLSRVCWKMTKHDFCASRDPSGFTRAKLCCASISINTEYLALSHSINKTLS